MGQRSVNRQQLLSVTSSPLHFSSALTCALQGLYFLQGMLHLLWCSPPWAAVWLSASLWYSQGAAGETLLWCLETSCSTSLTLVFILLLLTFFLSSFVCLMFTALSHIRFPRGATTLAAGLSRALRWGQLEPAGTCRAWHGAAPASPHRGRP